MFAVALATLSYAGETVDPLRLGDNVVPSRQQVTLTLDANQERYSGYTSIDITIREATESFRLHAEDMTLTDVTLQGGDEIVLLDHQAGEAGLVALFADQTIEPGDYTLKISFENDFGTRGVGLYRVVRDGQGYSFTQMEAIDARAAFPCFDEPGFKYPWQFTISVPVRHVAITNTPLRERSAERGWKTYVFEESKPLPSYLIAIATGPFSLMPIKGLNVPGNVVVLPGQEPMTAAAIEMTPPILEALEAWFGEEYPYAKNDLIAVPEYWFGAMENPGAITFLDQILLIDAESASVRQIRTLANVIAHELAHMWFGDVVTMQWWDDLWLNETFADWLGERIAHQVYPEYGMDIETIRSSLNIMRRDALASAEPVKQYFAADDDFTENVGVHYNKGKAILTMFEQQIGAEAFRKGVLDYIEKYRWGNATSDDLWQSLSESSGSADLATSLATFIEQPGVPMISLRQTDDGIEISQKRFSNAGTELDEYLWRIPVALRYADANGVHETSFELTDVAQTVELESDELRWVMPNANAAGYYVWSVPEAMMTGIATDAGANLSVPERVAYLGNLSSLLDAGAVPGDTHLRSLLAFADDPSPAVIGSLIDQLDKVEPAFGHLDGFDAYTRELFGAALERWGSEAVEGEAESVAILRPGLLLRVGDHGRAPAVLEQAEVYVQDYMKDPASVDPSLASTMMRLAAIDGDSDLYDLYREQFENAPVPIVRARFLSGLGAFHDPEIYADALDYVLSDSLRVNERRNLLGSLWGVDEQRDALFDWMTEHHSELRESFSPEMESAFPLYAGGCSVERMQRAEAYYTQPENTVAGTEPRLERMINQVTDCTRLRERETATIANYLNIH